MSTAYRVRPALPWDKLWDNLPDGVTEEIVNGKSMSTEYSGQRCLTNGHGYLWAFSHDGSDTTFECYGSSGEAADEMLELIAEAFGVSVFSENDDDYRDSKNLVPAKIVEVSLGVPSEGSWNDLCNLTGNV